MNTNQTMSALLIVASTLISGCANNNQQSSSQPSGSYSESYGRIDSINIERSESNGSGAGAVVGGVVGGLLGNQVGGGSGRAAATAAGVIGGALVGNNLEKNQQDRSREIYKIGIRLDNGSYYTVTQDSISDLRVGDRVRVNNDHVYHY